MDEKKLTRMLCDREQQGMDELLCHYGPMIRYIIAGILPQQTDREECLNDVCMQIWNHIHTFDPTKGRLSTWLTAIARNAARNRLRVQQRQQGREEEIDPTMPDPAPGPEEQALRKERAERIRDAVRQLSPAEQTLFYRKYYYLQSTERIAAEMGLTPRGVEGRLRRLRLRLRKLLGGEQL